MMKPLLRCFTYATFVQEEYLPQLDLQELFCREINCLGCDNFESPKIQQKCVRTWKEHVIREGSIGRLGDVCTAVFR